MPLNVTLYGVEPTTGAVTSGDEFLGYDYISLVNDSTFGPPPLVAPLKGERPRARPGDKVFYINTRLVPAFEIERVEDSD